MDSSASIRLLAFISLICSLICCWSLQNGRSALAEEQSPAVPEKFVAAFREADSNKDQKISIEEFLVNRKSADVAKRDFKLFDFDESDTLDLAEFAAIPEVAGGRERGPISDPMDDVLDQMVTMLDTTLSHWNDRPNLQIQTTKFFQILNQKFVVSQVRFNPGTTDEDRNGLVNRQEARRFLEIQLGIRRGLGARLRRPDGRIFNFMLFNHLDLNRSNQIELAEFKQRAHFSKTPEQDFAAADRNNDQAISVEEWEDSPQFGTNDPIAEFRALDTNLDAYLTLDELKSVAAEWKKDLASRTLRSFDFDHDDRLSLFEYRLTPQANMILPWDWKLTDNDGDGALSFSEFRFDPAAFTALDRLQFPFLRLMVFNRFDENRDGKLDPNEYVFKTKAIDEFFVMNEDGSGWQSLFLFPGHFACGSVAISPDGKSIAFDSQSVDEPKSTAIYVMELGTNQPRRICSGMMPSWSKDGQLLVCSRNEPKNGVWVVELDGDQQDFLGAGWGGQYSPDGQQIAFNQGLEIKILNVENDVSMSRTILGSTGNPYQRLFWNMAWSPDGRQLCFKGIKPDGTEEVATIDVVDDKHTMKVHHSGKVAVNADFAWHPTQNRIVYAMMCEERGFMQLYEFDPTKNDPPRLMKGQDQTRNNTDVCWTPDGKQLLIVSGDF